MPNKVELWINAFIPRNVAHYTVAVTKGIYAAKTAVPLPGVARLNPLNLFKPLHQGYLTDQRDFSDVQTASVRMQTSATVLILPTSLMAAGRAPTTSGTIGVDLSTGKVTGTASANLSKCTTNVIHGIPGATDIVTGKPLAKTLRSVVVEFVSAGSDPLVSMSAAIDYWGKFQVIHDPATQRIVAQFSGGIDDFPAFEAYASYNGTTKTLFTAPPPPGNTVVDLLGPARRIGAFSVSFP